MLHEKMSLRLQFTVGFQETWAQAENKGICKINNSRFIQKF